MAGISREDSGVGSSTEGFSSGQQLCESGEALAEWQSSEQLENGTPSTSPPYWDTDDDDDFGPKPSELYGKYTWKIDKFSQINKRELHSNAFEVGGYKCGTTVGVEHDNTFISETGAGKHVPRPIFDEVAGTYRLFHPEQLISGKEDATKFCSGVLGFLNTDQVMKLANNWDSLGSLLELYEKKSGGLGSLLLEPYEKKSELGFPIYPSQDILPDNFMEDKILKVISGTLRLQTEFVHCEMYLMSKVGTGILLDKKGHILTNAHIVSVLRDFKVEGEGTLTPRWLAASSVLANFEDGEQYYAEILSVNIGYDLAILRVPESVIKPSNIPCEFSKDVPGRGVDFFLVGHPHVLTPFNVKYGHLSHPSRCFPYPPNPPNHMDPAMKFLELDVMAAPGCSGGPLSTVEGQVFGVLHAGFEGIAIGYGIPVAIIKSALGRMFERSRSPGNDVFCHLN